MRHVTKECAKMSDSRAGTGSTVSEITFFPRPACGGCCAADTDSQTVGGTSQFSQQPWLCIPP